MQNLLHPGHDIAYRVGRYVVHLIWVRPGVYRTEVRSFAALAVGTLLYEKGHDSESAARQDARYLVDLCN